MTATAKTLQEKIADADEKGGRWLAKANDEAERGNHEKGQYWLDRANRLLGNA